MPPTTSSLALAAMGQTDRERMPLYREHRTLLRNGQWRRVVEELTGLAEMDAKNEKVRTEIAYLSKHGDAGRLPVSDLPQIGPSLGQRGDRERHPSGNQSPTEEQRDVLREEHAEAMLQVRAQVISKRWTNE